MPGCGRVSGSIPPRVSAGGCVPLCARFTPEPWPPGNPRTPVAFHRAARPTAASAARHRPAARTRYWYERPCTPSIFTSAHASTRPASCQREPEAQDNPSAIDERPVGQCADYRCQRAGVFQCHVTLVHVHQGVAHDDRATGGGAEQGCEVGVLPATGCDRGGFSRDARVVDRRRACRRTGRHVIEVSRQAVRYV